MNSVIKLTILTIFAFSINACSHEPEVTDQPDTITKQYPVKDKTFKVQSIKPEKDGYTLSSLDKDANAYQMVISPANLGAKSKFDFNKLKPGVYLKISGEYFNIGEVKHVTIFVADYANGF